MATRLAMIAAFLVACGHTVPHARAAQQQNRQPHSDTLQFGQGILLKDQPEMMFSDVAYDTLSPAIRSQTDNYLAFYLTSEAQPRNDPQFTTRTFSAGAQSQNDLVEYRWTFAGVHLRSVQSLNALKINIPLRGHGNVEDMKALVASIVKLKGTDIEGRGYEVHLRWPSVLGDGTQFSSEPDANILFLSSWHDRVDAFVDGNGLNILIYKKSPQLMGYQDGSMWFHNYPPKKTSSK